MKHLFSISIIILFFGACLGAGLSDFKDNTERIGHATHVAVISPSLMIMSFSSWLKILPLPNIMANYLDYLICLVPLSLLVIKFHRKKFFHVILRYSLSLLFFRIAINKFSMNVENGKQLDPITVNNGIFNYDDKRSTAQILGKVSVYLLYIYAATIFPRLFSCLLKSERISKGKESIVALFKGKPSGFICAAVILVIAIGLSIYFPNSFNFSDYVTNLYPGLLYDSSRSMLPSEAFKDTTAPAPIFLKTISTFAFIVIFNIISLNEAYCGIFGVFSFVVYQAAIILMATRIMYQTIYVRQNEDVTEENEKSYITLDVIMKTSSLVLLMQCAIYVIALILTRLFEKINLELLYTCSQVAIFAILILVDQFRI